jgi:hypothetical protein
MTTPITQLSSSQLRRAADLRDKIEALESELASLLGGAVTPKSSTAGASPKKARFMSAAARKRIADAQRARWAKVRAAKKAQ